MEQNWPGLLLPVDNATNSTARRLVDATVGEMYITVQDIALTGSRDGRLHVVVIEARGRGMGHVVGMSRRARSSVPCARFLTRRSHTR